MSIVTLTNLEIIFGHAAGRWQPLLTTTGARINLNTTTRWAYFLAQLWHESNFEPKAENLTYTTTAALQRAWPSRFPTPESAEPYLRNPELLANTVYANRMGNGPPESGDGYKYRGRGLIQLTGRNNYAAYAKFSGADVIENPDLLLIDKHALGSAAWYWHVNNLNRFADSSDFKGLTRAINGGLNGLEDRERRLAIVRTAINTYTSPEPAEPDALGRFNPLVLNGTQQELLEIANAIITAVINQPNAAKPLVVPLRSTYTASITTTNSGQKLDLRKEPA